jgi:hypothetical protein
LISKHVPAEVTSDVSLYIVPDATLDHGHEEILETVFTPLVTA